MLLTRKFMVTLLLFNCFLATGSSEELSRIHKWKKHSKFASLYHLAKDYLNNASIYNTSVEFTVPLFSFTFPTVENPNDYTSIMKQNILGQFIFFVVIIVSFMLSIAFPAFLNEVAPKSRMFPETQYYHNLLSNRTNGKIQDRVNIKQCVLRAGCEGYTNYEEYGFIALPFQYVFLSTNSQNVSQWRKDRKCSSQFQCPFNALRLLRYIINLVFKFIPEIWILFKL